MTDTVRTQEGINQDFTILASQLGNKQFQIQLLGAEIQGILQKMSDLNQEAKKLQTQAKPIEPSN